MTQSTDIQRFKLDPSILDAVDAPRYDLAGLEVRVLTDAAGLPWFVARDTCMVLGIANVADAVGRLEDDEHKQDKLSVVTNDPSDDLRRVTLVNEPGLYSLIMLSRKPQARAFKRWVTHEVLPAIRKTGSYAAVAPPKTRVELARELLAAEERTEMVLAQLAENAPKVEAFEELMSADGTFSLAQAAQLVGLGRQTLIDKLAAWRVVMVRPGHSDHLRPYQNQVQLGRFTCVAQAVDITHGDGTAERLVKSTTRVTAKGVEWIRIILRAGDPRFPLAR